MEKKYKVYYGGGEGRYSTEGIDYMLVRLPNADDETVELYAEIDPEKVFDSMGRPAYIVEEYEEDDEEDDEEEEIEPGWNYDFEGGDPERASFWLLRDEIIRLAKQNKINPEMLDFDEEYRAPDYKGAVGNVISDAKYVDRYPYYL